MRASPRRSRRKEDRHFVAALARGLSVLACFRTSDKVLSNQEIAERCELPRSTVSRLTHTLTRLGYLQYVESTAKYRLGTATLALGSAMLARMNARQLARPLMQEVAEATGAVVSMGTYAQLNMIYVEICRSRAPVTISLDVGARLPLATTAMGRAYLAVIPEVERRELMAQIRDHDRSSWPRLREGIEAALAEYHELGICSSFGGWQKDLNGIAAGIRPGGGTPTLAISCGGPAFQLSPEFLLNVARPRLIELVRRLKVTLGVEPD
ncbi:MAG TPA: IclR family transcriptional regulator [Candidatus Acidoferrum sp.]|nr:IclR family transcriptional regulator [Candidatus Acidoferrum sp.]